jgi:predicted GNAT superfamily acetyltransferase
VPTTPPPAAPKDFQFRRLNKPEEFRAAEEVARESAVSEDPVPPSLLRSLQDQGGLVLGAFAEIYLAGFVAGVLGWDGQKLYHYSLQSAVRPEYQNHHLGYRLKLQQRDEMLRQGLDELRWTFDPLVSRNAHLFVRRLGATPGEYLVHYFGHIHHGEHEEVESDRLRLRWKLTDPGVVARLETSAPPADRAADERRFASSTAIVETETDDQGLRVPSAVQEPSATSVHLEVPFDLALIREHSPGNLRSWRHATRDAFRAAFDTGYEVDDFAVVAPGHERRSVYFLTKRAAPA